MCYTSRARFFLLLRKKARYHSSQSVTFAGIDNASAKSLPVLTGGKRLPKINTNYFFLLIKSGLVKKTTEFRLFHHWMGEAFFMQGGTNDENA